MRRVRIVGTLAGLCALAVPVASGAQTIGGFGRGRGPGRLVREPGIVVPKVVNAVNLMIEHRQELALSDTQFARVIVIKRALDSTNAPLVRKLDSVQRLFRGGPIFSDPTPARRDSLAEARSVVQEAIGAITENNGTARDEAYGMLSVQQLATAQSLEAKAEQALEDEARRGKKGGESPSFRPFGRSPLG
jgi:hypothetical protein